MIDVLKDEKEGGNQVLIKELGVVYCHETNRQVGLFLVQN
jgi:hypothetical protein